MTINNEQITIDDGVAFCIDVKDSVQAFSSILHRKIPFSIDFVESGVLIYPPKDKFGIQQSIQDIQDALNHTV